MLLTIVSLIFGFALGAALAPRVNSMVDFEGMQQRKAIKEKFECKSNEFTYFFEGVDDYYILSLRDTEYRIKFSLKFPLKVVYSEVVGFMQD